MMREGRQHAFELQVRQHRDEIHRGRESFAQLALVAVVLRHDQRAQRRDLPAQPFELFLGTLASALAFRGERRDTGIERGHPLIKCGKQARQPTREERAQSRWHKTPSPLCLCLFDLHAVDAQSSEDVAGINDQFGMVGDEPVVHIPVVGYHHDKIVARKSLRPSARPIAGRQAPRARACAGSPAPTGRGRRPPRRAHRTAP